MKPQYAKKNAMMPEHSLSEYIIKVAQQATESASFGCFDWIGKGDEKLADQAAVNAMRNTLNSLEISGRIVIGEGERDEAPMLYIGEELGLGGEAVDIAVDPLEGTTLCAHAMPNSLAVMAIAQRGALLHAPDVYMQKIAIGSGLPENIVDLDMSINECVRNLSKAKKKPVSELSVCVLKRPRHDELLAKLRESGARVHLITDGDVSASIATTIPDSGVDMYIGSGGAPEGVLAASALACVGGFMQGRLLFNTQEERDYATKLGITDLNLKYDIDDMVKSDVVFCATGVTDGWMLKGVRITQQYKSCNNLVMHRASGLVSTIENKYYISC